MSHLAAKVRPLLRLVTPLHDHVQQAVRPGVILKPLLEPVVAGRTQRPEAAVRRVDRTAVAHRVFVVDDFGEDLPVNLCASPTKRMTPSEFL